ncbi:hypothetical protein D3C85_1611970 [compost metagenome]
MLAGLSPVSEGVSSTRNTNSGVLIEIEVDVYAVIENVVLDSNEESGISSIV